ncbi:MAG TPA: type II/IV secretion system protein [Caldithrix abyssi]|uniref:Type II/IV secretion system protein n=1 Tax=Caldithrix abyssi TaxID=187145 RepID=A0A7V1PVP0_CALAY|nr:type II/IV secretion system protein [Caldithrix abyssi]
MDISDKLPFEDSWLARAFVYYKVIDKSLAEELAYRYSDQRYFYNILTANNFLNPNEIRQFIKIALQIPSVNLDKVDAEQEVLDLIPEEVCQRYGLLGIQMNKTHIAVAFSNPFNLDAENEIEYISGRYVKKFYAPLNVISQKLSEYYSPEEIITSLVKSNIDHKNIRFAGDSTMESDAPVIKLVNQIVSDSITKETSDIHIEPKEKTVLVRFRIDGVLRNELEIPRSLHSALVSRIKIISNLNIAESRKPQDGKAKVYIDDMDFDLRVSILPTNFGEKVVIRILDKRKASLSLDQLGIKGYNRTQLEKCFGFKQGMVLVTGPTGSGKSTTLYAAINRIRSTTNNILTIEDPIEYMFEGINQVQVNEKAGVTFASALRSFLRQDPDVILVGEIRDEETAEISVQASLTGHLVLSTLHTNDTFTTVTRLKDMGVDKFKITEALQAVIAQRLVRRLCPHCKTAVDKSDIDEKLLKMLGLFSEKPQIYEPRGCSRCGYVGYKGRIGVYEILVLDNTIRELITGDASVQSMRKAARAGGFRNLFEDALNLVATGVTDYNEIVRVVNPVATRASRPVNEAVAERKPPAEDNGKLKLNLSEKTEPAPVAPGVESPEATSPPRPAVAPAPHRAAKILITDDAPQTRMLVSKIIEKMTPWEVMEAEDGEKALEVIAGEKPDLIVLDIMMPNMDGYELLQELKSNPEYEHIPVLIFTALKTPKSEQKVYELGADGFLVKPIEPKRMVEQIKKALERRRFTSNTPLLNNDTRSEDEEVELQLM